MQYEDNTLLQIAFPPEKNYGTSESLWGTDFIT